jgi:ATP-dependent protease HslVU (ClpYQ) peptidase subunit
MTTIAYRNGILAADSLITAGNRIATSVSATKIIRLSDGRLLGHCGQMRHMKPLVAFLEGRSERYPDMEKDATAIVVHVEGRVELHYGRHPDEALEEEAEFFAIGSGAELALGAMAVGVSAIEAVRAAIRFDTGSGGEVKHLELQPYSVRKLFA